MKAKNIFFFKIFKISSFYLCIVLLAVKPSKTNLITTSRILKTEAWNSKSMHRQEARSSQNSSEYQFLEQQKRSTNVHHVQFFPTTNLVSDRSYISGFSCAYLPRKKGYKSPGRVYRRGVSIVTRPPRYEYVTCAFLVTCECVLPDLSLT